MRRFASLLLLLIGTLATAATARADAIDKLLAQAGLAANEIDRKSGGKSWGEIFGTYFSGHGTQREIQGVGYAGYLPLTASGRSYGRMVSMADLREWDRQLTPVKQV